MLKSWLAHPLTLGLDLDDPRTTNLRRRIILEKGFLRRIYEEWYADIATRIPAGEGHVLELGSGAGFLDQVIPGVIKSDVFPCENIDAVLDGQQLPVATGALRALVMTNVLHHIAKPRCFFREAARCLRPGGVVIMLEPWNTRWSRLIYSQLHHEPFCPEATQWEFPSAGPLSDANGALPWMIFERDRTQFEQEFPQLAVHAVQPRMPFRYLVSGGISMRGLMPEGTFTIWDRLERILQPGMASWGMFAQIELVRV